MAIPIDGDGGGGGGGGGEPPPGTLPGLAGWLRPRYSSNLVVNEEIKLIDLIHEVIAVSSRHYLSMGSNGKIRLQNKKPVDWGLSTGAYAINDTSIAIDDVRAWIASVKGYLLIDPYTAQSEVRKVIDADYSTAQNSITLTQTGVLFTISGFSGCDGNTTPATATLTIGTPVASTTYAIQLDGIEISFTPSASDTAVTVGSFLTGSIMSHPKLQRRFIATWNGSNVITIKGKFGTLDLDSALGLAHAAPVINPVTAPTLTAASGALAAGVYKVAYAYKNARGQTLLSKYKSITLTANQKITVSAISLPGGTTVVWYVVCEAGSSKLRYHSENNGASFDITSLPLLTASLPPDLNRTGAEVMRIQAVFSDRANTRTGRLGSNVIRVSYEWLLGNREKSINRIDFKYRDSGQDWRLVELRLRDDAHIAKTKKVSNLEINGQAVDNYFQAYRLTSSLLAELRDADFFYKWSATREALLLEEGDVCAVTDDSSGVINLPIRLESIEMDISNAGLPKNSFIGRKYYTQLYDDSPNDVNKPIVIEP